MRVFMVRDFDEVTGVYEFRFPLRFLNTITGEAHEIRDEAALDTYLNECDLDPVRMWIGVAEIPAVHDFEEVRPAADFADRLARIY